MSHVAVLSICSLHAADTNAAQADRSCGYKILADLCRSCFGFGTDPTFKFVSYIAISVDVKAVSSTIATKISLSTVEILSVRRIHVSS